jgi:hypothetical protein
MRDAMSAGRAVEEELTFALDAEAVPHVARLLLAAPLGWQGTAVKALPRSPRTVLHLYLAPTAPSATRRIRVKVGHRPPVLLLESKRLLREDLFLAQKQETTDDPALSLEDAWALLAAPGAVISSFTKNQYRVHLSCGTGEFKASLDQVIPFMPQLPLTTAGPEWHLEFEGGSGWSPEGFLRSAFFSASFAPLVRSLLFSKWQLARMGPPASIPVASADAMREYIDTISAHAIGTRMGWRELAGGRSKPPHGQPGEHAHLGGHR